MNLEELENNWREYALIGLENKDLEMLALADVFWGCERSGEGLIFFLKFGAYWNLKCDEDGSCWCRTSFEDSWSRFGRLVPIGEIRKDPEKLKRLKKCAELFWMQVGGY
ncbi:MAG: hypothetical protein AAB674_01635 [Patescibacteria group bacterium]